MVQEPEALNAHYFDVFVKILRARMPEYDKAEKRSVTPFETVDNIPFRNSGPVLYCTSTVEWDVEKHHFDHPLSLDKVDPEVENVVRHFAEKFALKIEKLIAEVAKTSAPICCDIFTLSNGARNLQTFYGVAGPEHDDVSDPTGSITGWFAFKVLSGVYPSVPPVARP